MAPIDYNFYAKQIGKRVRDNIVSGFNVTNSQNFFDPFEPLAKRSRPTASRSVGFAAPMVRRRRTFKRRRPMRRMRRRSSRGVRKYFSKKGFRLTRRSKLASKIRSLKPIKYYDDPGVPTTTLLATTAGYSREAFTFAPVQGSSVNERDSTQSFLKMLHIKGVMHLNRDVKESVLVCMAVRRQTTATFAASSNPFLYSGGGPAPYSRNGDRYGFRLNPGEGIPIYKKWFVLNPELQLRTFDVKIKLNEAVRTIQGADLPSSSQDYSVEFFFIDNNIIGEFVPDVVNIQKNCYFSYVDGA